MKCLVYETHKQLFEMYLYIAICVKKKAHTMYCFITDNQDYLSKEIIIQPL